ncbi:Arm DNA-binding domain-containing protein [Paraburkholderia fungorum]|uniref:Arm DNA-binding domain-containing protein n=1 Tax=Paraburkholderia fungorum TaxID=134537 RepID=UPI0038B94C2F
MALPDAAVRKVKAGAKSTKLSDDGGLFLLLNPNGSRLWRLTYRFAGTEKLLAFGSYPEVSLKDGLMTPPEALCAAAGASLCGRVAYRSGSVSMQTLSAAGRKEEGAGGKTQRLLSRLRNHN